MPYILIFLLMIIGGMGYTGKQYYDSSQATIYTLKENQSKLEQVIEEKDAEMERVKEDIKLQQEAMNKLTLQSQQIQAEMNRYLDIFKRHNLTKLAAAKPGLIETRANKGTKDVFDSIENDSRLVDELDD